MLSVGKASWRKRVLDQRPERPQPGRSGSEAGTAFLEEEHRSTAPEGQEEGGTERRSLPLAEGCRGWTWRVVGQGKELGFL